MASSKEYVQFLMEQLSSSDVSYRAMMGEYVIYCKDKVAGGVYDDRFLIKPVEAAKRLMPNAVYEIPYPGAKEMLLVDNVDNRQFLKELMEAIYDELPAPKPKRKKKQTEV